MKKILIVLMVLLLPTFSWAASSKVADLTEDTAPASDSLIYTVDDPAGTAVDRKVTLGNLGKGLVYLGPAITTSANGDTVFPLVNDAATPTIAFGDGDTGFAELSDDALVFVAQGIHHFKLTPTGNFESSKFVGGGGLSSAAATATIPVHIFNGDTNTGLGRAAADQLSLIAGGVEGIRIETNTGNVAVKFGGDVPVLSSCGTTPAVTGSSSAGKITIGTGATTSCTATFDQTFTAAPACVISGDNNAIGYATTTSATVLTITSSADMDSDVISYICIGIL